MININSYAINAKYKSISNAVFIHKQSISEGKFIICLRNGADVSCKNANYTGVSSKADE